MEAIITDKEIIQIIASQRFRPIEDISIIIEDRGDKGKELMIQFKGSVVPEYNITSKGNVFKQALLDLVGENFNFFAK